MIIIKENISFFILTSILFMISSRHIKSIKIIKILSLNRRQLMNNYFVNLIGVVCPNNGTLFCFKYLFFLHNSNQFLIKSQNFPIKLIINCSKTPFLWHLIYNNSIYIQFFMAVVYPLRSCFYFKNFLFVSGCHFGSRFFLF